MLRRFPIVLKHFREEKYNDFGFENLPAVGILPEIPRERRATRWPTTGRIPTDVSSGNAFWVAGP